MRSSHSLDRLDTAFDDDRLVADAGLKLPATLAQHLDLRELIEEHLDLGSATGAATGGDKVLRAGGSGEQAPPESLPCAPTRASMPTRSSRSAGR